MAERICIDCRTLLGPAEERCDAARFHRVVSLSKAAGRERLRTHVWGPPEFRTRAGDAAKAGGLGAFLEGAAYTGCEALGAGAEIVGLLLLAALAFIVVAGAYWLVVTIVDRVRRYRDRLRPVGVQPTIPVARERWRGRIASGPSITPPITDREGVAWGIVLESSDAIGKGPLLLLAGETLGFRVELEGGGVLEVPAGRVRIAPARAGWQRIPADLVHAWASNLDRRHAEEAHPAIPSDRGRIVTLAIGDPIELDVATTARPGEGGAYREANAVRVAAGVPSIR